MGYSTTVINGKTVYCCDRCDNAPAKKYYCPHGYCPPCYLCPDCWRELKANGKWREAHKKCKEGHENFEAKRRKEREMIESGHFLRCSALNHTFVSTDDQEITRVKVIFRGKQKEIAYFMAPETYRSIELLMIATPDDYRKHGILEPCQNSDIYQNI